MNGKPDITSLTKGKIDEESATVVSAVPLDKSEVETLRKYLTHLVGTPISVVNKLDSSVIGGLAISLRDKVIDLTLRKKIDNLKDKLLS